MDGLCSMKKVRLRTGGTESGSYLARDDAAFADAGDDDACLRASDDCSKQIGRACKRLAHGTVETESEFVKRCCFDSHEL